jgi:hypothetical protein
LVVDDIDDADEVVVMLNGRHPVAMHGSVLGEGSGHEGAVEVPVGALRKRSNTFDFTFADNLDGTTEGFVILKAELYISIKDEHEVPL